MGDPVGLPQTAPCRAQRSTPVQDNGMLLVGIFAAFVVGYALTVIFLQTRGVSKDFDRAPEEFGLFKAVLGVVGGLALLTLVYCIAALLGLRRLCAASDWRRLSAACAAAIVPLGVIFAALFIGSAGMADSVNVRLSEATRPFILCAAGCTVPGLTGLLLVRAIARDEREWSENGPCQVALLRRLRIELQRFLGILGALVTLLVIATGLRRQAVLALEPKTHFPAVSVVLYGLVFATLLGTFYATAQTAVDARAAALVESYTALPAPDASDLVAVLGRRAALNSLVGLGEGPWRTFQNAVVVAAPLLSALVSSAMGGS